MVDSSRRVGYFYILGSLSCALGCVGAYRVKTIDVPRGSAAMFRVAECQRDTGDRMHLLY